MLQVIRIILGRGVEGVSYKYTKLSTPRNVRPNPELRFSKNEGMDGSLRKLLEWKPDKRPIIIKSKLVSL